MFRDLKEYQEIQSIYESKVCISDEQKIITSIFEEQEFTEEELDYIKENLDEVYDKACLEILEEIQDLSEEVLTEDKILITEMVLNEGIGSAIKAGLRAAAPVAKKGLSLAKKGIEKAAPVVKKGLKKGVEVAKKVAKATPKVVKSAASKVKQGIKAVATNPTVRKAGKMVLQGTGLGAGFVGGVALAKRGIKAIKNRLGDKKGGGDDKKGGGQSGGGQSGGGQSGGGSDSKPEKKMSQIEKDNRQRFGNKRVDFLKQKQKDFRARQKGEMSKDDFNKKYPKSQSAKDAYARKNPNSSQAMQNMSYEPEGTPIQETSGYDPIKNYHLANDLAKVYQKIYEPAEESLTEDVQNYNALVDFIIKEEIVSTVEEADAIIAELDSELIESYLTEGVITEGLMDAVNRVKQGVGNVVKKVGAAAGGAVNKAKQVAGNVKTAVGNEIQKRREQIGDFKRGGASEVQKGNQLRGEIAQKKETLKKQQSSSGPASGSGMANDPNKTKAQLLAKQRQRQKMSNPNQKQLSGAERAKQMARERLAAKESVEKDAYTVVLEYLLDQKHAATIEEANYIMTELDTETIQGIISES